MNLFLTLSTLILTIMAALALGIAASYAAIHGILTVFGNHSQRLAAPARLVESHASGD